MLRHNLRKKLLAIIAGSAALVTCGTVNALTIALDDPAVGVGFDVMVSDGDGDGVVTFNGAIGGGSVWSVNVTTGTGPPLEGPSEIGLTSVNATSETAGGRLTIAVWDTGLGPLAAGQSGFFGYINSTQVGHRVEQAVFRQFELGTAPPAGGPPNVLSQATVGPFVSNFDVSTIFADNSLPADGHAFDLGIEVLINHTGAGQLTTFDAAIVPTPLPAAAWLMGSALVLLAGIGRRASKKRDPGRLAAA